MGLNLSSGLDSQGHLGNRNSDIYMEEVFCGLESVFKLLAQLGMLNIHCCSSPEVVSLSVSLIQLPRWNHHPWNLKSLGGATGLFARLERKVSLLSEILNTFIWLGFCCVTDKSKMSWSKSNKVCCGCFLWRMWPRTPNLPSLDQSMAGCLQSPPATGQLHLAGGSHPALRVTLVFSQQCSVEMNQGYSHTSLSHIGNGGRENLSKDPVLRSPTWNTAKFLQKPCAKPRAPAVWKSKQMRATMKNKLMLLQEWSPKKGEKQTSGATVPAASANCVMHNQQYPESDNPYSTLN